MRLLIDHPIEITNQHKKRRVELAEKTRILREQEFLDEIKLQELEKALPNDLEEKLKETATSEVKTEELKKKQNVLHQLHASQAAEAKMKAQNEFYKSNEYNQMFQERVDNEKEAAKTQKKIEENDLNQKSFLFAQQKKLQAEIQSKFIDDQFSLSQQIAYVTNDVLNPLYDKVDPNYSITNKLVSLKNQYADAWKAFINDRRFKGVTDRLNHDKWIDTTEEDLKTIFDLFNNFINEWSKSQFDSQED